MKEKVASFVLWLVVGALIITKNDIHMSQFVLCWVALLFNLFVEIIRKF